MQVAHKARQEPDAGSGAGGLHVDKHVGGGEAVPHGRHQPPRVHRGRPPAASSPRNRRADAPSVLPRWPAFRARPGSRGRHTFPACIRPAGRPRPGGPGVRPPPPRCPGRSAAAAPAGSWSPLPRARPGWSRRSRATAGAAMYALKPSVAVMRTTPATGSGALPAGPSALTAASTCSATRTASVPSSVSSQPPAARARTRPPNAFSSAAIRRETVVWFRPKACAAVVNFAERDTASRTSRSSGLAFISAIVHIAGAALAIECASLCSNTRWSH